MIFFNEKFMIFPIVFWRAVWAEKNHKKIIK